MNNTEIISTDDDIRRDIWYHMLDSERLFRYYDNLGKKYRRYDMYVKGLILFGAMTGISTSFSWKFLANTKIEILLIIPGILLIIATIIDFIGGFSEKAALCGVISIRCNEISTRIKNIWLIENKSYYDTDADFSEYESDYLELKNELDSVTALSSAKNIEEDVKIHEKAACDAYEILEKQYAA